MNKKFSLLLTDNEITLYQGSSQKTYPLTAGMEHLQTELKHLFSRSPEISLRVLIDRIHQDIREDQLPPLIPWDRMRLLFHKREEWASQKGFHGYHFFKQDGKSFLQWVNIMQGHSLMPWLLWIKSLSNPLEGVFFVSLEAGRFLKKHLLIAQNNIPKRHEKILSFFPLLSFPRRRGTDNPLIHRWIPSFLGRTPLGLQKSKGKSDSYAVLIYALNSHKIRYVIFNGSRLLLARPFSGEEDLRTSLHFLSRLSPSIHEELYVLSLVDGISLTFPRVITLSNPHVFMDFLVSQKSGTLSLNLNGSSKKTWAKKVLGFCAISSFVVTGLMIYQNLNIKNDTKILLSKINELEKKIKERKKLRTNKDFTLLRSAIEHYDYIRHQIRSPLETLKRLENVLAHHQLRLHHLTWDDGQPTSLEIAFFMHNLTHEALSNQFKALLSSLGEAFLNSHIQVIEAPLNSGSHETFEYPSSLDPPMGRIRISGL